MGRERRAELLATILQMLRDEGRRRVTIRNEWNCYHEVISGKYLYLPLAISCTALYDIVRGLLLIWVSFC
jgi:hypothetical protein